MKLKENSSIAVIGNALSLFNSRYGEEIDSRDYVLRINLGNNLNLLKAKSHGTKHSFAIFSNVELKPFASTIERMYDNGIPIVHCSDKGRNSARWAERVEFLPIYKENDLDRPSCGFLVLHYLLNVLKIQQVDLYGFDFKETPTFYNPNRTHEPHNYEIEKSLIMADGRICRHH